MFICSLVAVRVQELLYVVEEFQSLVTVLFLPGVPADLLSSLNVASDLGIGACRVRSLLPHSEVTFGGSDSEGETSDELVEEDHYLQLFLGGSHNNRPLLLLVTLEGLCPEA